MRPPMLVLGALAVMLSASPALAATPVSPENTVDRLIRIDDSTKYINVTDGETVILDINGKRLAWHVDAVDMYPFDLGRVVPEAQGVTVYVEPDPKYEGD